MLDNPPDILLFLGLTLWIVFPYIMGKAWLSTWREHKNPDWLLLACPLLLQCILAVVYNNDLALISAHDIDNGATLPYGHLWFFLNPFYGTLHTYLFFLIGWNLAFAGIMYFLIQRKRLNLTWVYWCEILNVILILVHNPQSIVPMSFVYLVPAIGPVMLTVAGLIKLPVGWSMTLTDRHFQCAFAQIAPIDAPYWECLHFSPSYFLHSMDAWYNFTVYIILCAWIIRALKLWNNGRTPRKLAFDILNTTRTAGIVIKLMMKTGLYERQVTKLIKSLSGKVAVDIGSNDGYYTRLLKQRFQIVYPIDPNPKYDAYHFALSDTNRLGYLYTDSKSNRSSSLFPTFRYRKDNYSASKKIEVTVSRFDSLFEWADFVKIDVEGAEFEVIKGMSRADVGMVLVELHDETRISELVALLDLQNFTVTRIDRNHFLGKKPAKPF